MRTRWNSKENFDDPSEDFISRLRVRVQCRQSRVPTPIPRVGASRRTAYSEDIQVTTPIPRVGAKNVLCLTVQVRIMGAGSGGSVQTVGVRRFTGIISSFLVPTLGMGGGT